MVVTVLDSANLERNLYLAVQVLELGVPVVAALNMADVSESRGIKIDASQLSVALKSRVVRTVARENQGIKELINAIIETAKAKTL